MNYDLSQLPRVARVQEYVRYLFDDTPLPDGANPAEVAEAAYVNRSARAAGFDTTKIEDVRFFASGRCAVRLRAGFTWAAGTWKDKYMADTFATVQGAVLAVDNAKRVRG